MLVTSIFFFFPQGFLPYQRKFSPLTLSPQKNLDSSKLKDVANYNFTMMKMVKSSPKRIENIVGKGEIAHHEQFLLFQHSFQKTCNANKCFLVKGKATLKLLSANALNAINPFPNKPWFLRVYSKSLENTAGKGE